MCSHGGLSGKTHFPRMEIALLKMRPADLVVVSFYCCVLSGIHHRDDFILCGELEEVVVMSGVASERPTLAFEQFDVAVDRKQFFDECPTE